MLALKCRIKYGALGTRMHSPVILFYIWMLWFNFRVLLADMEMNNNLGPGILSVVNVVTGWPLVLICTDMYFLYWYSKYTAKCTAKQPNFGVVLINVLIFWVLFHPNFTFMIFYWWMFFILHPEVLFLLCLVSSV